MGIGAPGEAATSAELSGPDEAEEETGYEDESTVHHTASVGDMEVISVFLNFSILSLSFSSAALTSGIHLLHC